ncbi:MAG: hypothetical protein KGZ79_00140 [Dethiobacter sp.]|jgi:Tfp pilus assembly protein PilN|nr:hypothetical protein [Dethiobacter sp.]
MQVNLKPAEYTRRKQFYWPRLLKAVIACIYLLALIFAVITLRLDEQQLITEQLMLRNEIERLNPAVTEVRMLQEKTKAYTEKQKVIDLLNAEMLIWSDYITELHNGTEEDVIIEEFLSDIGGGINIRARTKSLKVATAFVFRMREMVSFQNVDYEIIVLNNNEFETRIRATLAGR